MRPWCCLSVVSPRRLAVLPCLLVLAALLPAAPASAAFPGKNGAIAYVGKVGGVTNLLKRSGNVVSGVLKGNVITSPAWSPQGRRLAAVRTSPEGTDIWIVGHDGLGARQLTSGGGHGDPAWSPKGDEIAFTEGPPGDRHIHAIGADGNGQRQITSGPNDERAPAWSAREQIAYVVRTARTGDDLYVINAHNGRPRRLTRLPGNEQAPSWAPGGRQIAFAHRGGIWRIPSAGGKARLIIRLEDGPATSPAWSPDGRRVLFSAGPRGKRRVYSVGLRGQGLRGLSTRRTDGQSPDWQPTGHDPVIAAAGDVACDPASPYFNGGAGVPRHCGMMRTGDLLLREDFWNVLVLGDTQYSNGTLDKFMASYDPTWGRSKHLQKAVVGNHEYQTGGVGHWDYFNGTNVYDGPGGPRGYGYYSFDVGEWHIVVLNSNCLKVPGGCDVGSPQERWLEADLAANPSKCTLAAWHSPLFSSYRGTSQGRGGDVSTISLWQTLYNAGTDVVLNGHHHFYERFAQQDAAGDYDAAGIRQFIVGTGGMSIDDAENRDPNSLAVIETTFGILRMTLRPGSYDWKFVSASADPVTDVGSWPCH